MPSSACYADLRALPSFPTRRSSDLVAERATRELAVVRRQVDAGLTALERSTELTAAGREFLAHTRAATDRLLAEAVPAAVEAAAEARSEEHTSELQSRLHLVCRLLLATRTSALYPLSLHDALPIWWRNGPPGNWPWCVVRWTRASPHWSARPS